MKSPGTRAEGERLARIQPLPQRASANAALACCVGDTVRIAALSQKPMHSLRLILLMLVASSPAAIACETTLPLDGTTLVVESCDRRVETCASAAQTLFKYAAIQDDGPRILSVGFQASPWRIYGPDNRITTVKEIASLLRPLMKKEVTLVRLDGNWTGSSPGDGRPSLAAQVSMALDGFPVEGREGFIWFKNDGSVRITRQSFTARRSGAYTIKPGADVMSALVPGWAVLFEEDLARQSEPNGVLLAAVGWDVFMLCPDRALQAFERADSLGSVIGAYNAAVMRLERHQPGDREAAIELLEHASRRGDSKSIGMLATLHKQQ